MTKIIASLALASLSVVLAACGKPSEGSAQAAEIAQPAQPDQAVSTEPYTPQWRSLAINEDTEFFIEELSYQTADWNSSDTLAQFKMEFREPRDGVSHIEAIYEFDCNKTALRYIMSESFDEDGNSIMKDGKTGPWMTPQPNTVNLLYTKAACTPALSKMR